MTTWVVCRHLKWTYVIDETTSPFLGQSIRVHRTVYDCLRSFYYVEARP